MPLTGSINPSSGPTPGVVHIQAGGGDPVYTVVGAVSPAGYSINVINGSNPGNGPWEVELPTNVPRGTKIEIEIEDSQGDKTIVTYTST